MFGEIETEPEDDACDIDLIRIFHDIEDFNQVQVCRKYKMYLSTRLQYLSVTQINQIPNFLPLTLLDLCTIEAFVNT